MSGKLSILVVRLSAIGDTVMTTAAVRALRRHMPEARISWVVEPKSVGVLEGNPDIDELIVWRRGSVLDFLRFAGMLRRHRFDVALDFQGLARSALIALASGAKRRIGFARGREFSKFGYSQAAPCSELPHGMRCYLELLSPLGVVCDDLDGDMRLVISRDEDASAAEVLAQAGVGPDDRFAALCPATTRQNKHWTEDGWGRLAEMLWSRLGLRAVFLGSKDDKPLVERIMAASSAPTVSVAGMTSLKLSTAVLARSSVVIAVDTGLLHAGVALGKPTVGVFGPTNAFRNHIGRPNFGLVRYEVDCWPCGGDPTCREFDCMRDLEPERVAAAVEAILARFAAEGVGS